MGVAEFNAVKIMDKTAIPNATALKAKDSVFFTLVFVVLFLSLGSYPYDFTLRQRGYSCHCTKG